MHCFPPKWDVKLMLPMKTLAILAVIASLVSGFSPLSTLSRGLGKGPGPATLRTRKNCGPRFGVWMGEVGAGGWWNPFNPKSTGEEGKGAGQAQGQETAGRAEREQAKRQLLELVARSKRGGGRVAEADEDSIAVAMLRLEVGNPRTTLYHPRGIMISLLPNARR